MPISIRCQHPSCGKSLRVPDKFAGKRTKCPGCGSMIVVSANDMPLDDFASLREGVPSPSATPVSKKDSLKWMWFTGAGLSLLLCVILVVVLLKKDDTPKPKGLPVVEVTPRPKPEPEPVPEIKPQPVVPLPPEKPPEMKPSLPTLEEKPPVVKPMPMPDPMPMPEVKPPEVKPPPMKAMELPTVKIARSEPADPRAGESLHIDLTGTHPERKPLVFQYRSDLKGEWLEALGGHIVMTGLKLGKITLEVRAEDQMGTRSAVVSQSWEVKEAESPPKTVGGVVQLKKVPPVRTNNQNTLIKEYAMRFTMSASSTWEGWPTSFATDDNIETSWFSAQNDSAAKGRKPWLQTNFPEDVKVTRVTILGNRDPAWLVGYTILSGSITLYDGKGKVLKHITNQGIGNFRDFDFRFSTPIEGVRSVRFTSLRDQGNLTTHGDIGIAEMQVE